MGNNLGTYKNTAIGRRTNVDSLDIAAFTRRPADEPVLESVNATGICMYADIRNMEIMVDVKIFVILSDSEESIIKAAGNEMLLRTQIDASFLSMTKMN